MASLIFKDGPIAGIRIDVDRELVVGGEDADVTVPVPQISHHHLVLRPADDGIEVEDLGSLNGTWVNGSQIQGPTRLREADIVELGGVSMEMEPLPARPATPAEETAAMPPAEEAPSPEPEPQPPPSLEQPAYVQPTPTPAPEPAPAPTPEPARVAAVPEPAATEVTFTHSGQRFILGFTPSNYAIWDRHASGSPIQRFPLTDEGWSSAWQLFSTWEPHAAEVQPETGSGPSQPMTEPGAAQPASAATPAAAPSAAAPPAAAPAQMQFTHSGQRFLLGYTSELYGIWDRLAPGPPIQRFALTDEGWASAWQVFSAWEPHAAEVPR